ncbi:hypothetical protein RsTz2092_12840 [Deferribacterales bacterium RsTz2092]|nr:hypothetical protein AGMMS49941_12560 [Deferribacterales bacterium]
MKKTILRIFFVIAVTVLFGSLLNITFSEGFISTIYNVSGIVFSIGLGLIVSFSIDGVKERDHIITIRKNIRNVRSAFIKYFVMATFVYLFYSHIPNQAIQIKNITIKFDSSWLAVIFILFSILYFIRNFIDIQKLKDDIFDKTLK